MELTVIAVTSDGSLSSYRGSLDYFILFTDIIVTHNITINVATDYGSIVARSVKIALSGASDINSLS